HLRRPRRKSEPRLPLPSLRSPLRRTPPRKQMDPPRLLHRSPDRTRQTPQRFQSQARMDRSPRTSSKSPKTKHQKMEIRDIEMRHRKQLGAVRVPLVGTPTSANRKSTTEFQSRFSSAQISITK